MTPGSENSSAAWGSRFLCQ